MKANHTTTEHAGQKVTIYTTTEMMGNIVKREGKLVEHGRRDYAQHAAAPFVKFIPKGARNTTGIQKSYQPYMLVLLGWGHPDPASLYGEAVAGNTPGATMAAGRHTSFADGWVSDFEAVLNPYLAERPGILIGDYRDRLPAEPQAGAGVTVKQEFTPEPQLTAIEYPPYPAQGTEEEREAHRLLLAAGIQVTEVWLTEPQGVMPRRQAKIWLSNGCSAIVEATSPGKFIQKHCTHQEGAAALPYSKHLCSWLHGGHDVYPLHEVDTTYHGRQYWTAAQRAAAQAPTFWIQYAHAGDTLAHTYSLRRGTTEAQARAVALEYAHTGHRVELYEEPASDVRRPVWDFDPMA